MTWYELRRARGTAQGLRIAGSVIILATRSAATDAGAVKFRCRGRRYGPPVGEDEKLQNWGPIE